MKLCARCERAAKGLCRCGKERAEGRSRCAECLEITREYARDLRANKAIRKEARERRRAQDAAFEEILRAREARA